MVDALKRVVRTIFNTTYIFIIFFKFTADKCNFSNNKIGDEGAKGKERLILKVSVLILLVYIIYFNTKVIIKETHIFVFLLANTKTQSQHRSNL